MIASIELIVPEDEQSEEVLRQYYTYRQAKRAKIQPDYEWAAPEETSGFQVGQEMLGDYFYLNESLKRELLDTIDHEKWYNKMGMVLERNTLYGEEIEELIDILREAQQALLGKGIEENM